MLFLQVCSSDSRIQMCLHTKWSWAFSAFIFQVQALCVSYAEVRGTKGICGYFPVHASYTPHEKVREAEGIRGYFPVQCIVHRSKRSQWHMWVLSSACPLCLLRRSKRNRGHTWVLSSASHAEVREKKGMLGNFQVQVLCASHA